MKKRFFITFLVVLLFNNLIHTVQAQDKNTEEKDRLIVYILNAVLTRSHFVKKELDDDFSKHVYKEFIDAVDPAKQYFTQKDIKDFSQFKYEIDDQLKKSDISFYKLVYNRFLDRVKVAKKNYKVLLEKPFNYSKNETINVDYDNIPFAKDEKELLNHWRKKLKLQVISKIGESEEQQKEKIKKDKTVKPKSFVELEKEVRAEVLKDMDNLYIRINELVNSDWYSVFLNCIVTGFDPHTTYMSPQSKSSFDQGMSGKLEGIGARLQKEGIYTKVVDLISGGPAWKQKELEEGDIILKVGQGDKKPVDIVGMRLDNAIKYIKGKKGTEVRLTVKKKIDGSIKVIPIVRDIVELEETFVKSSIVEKNGKKYGIIEIPKFYIDFKDTRKRNAASDMRKEIERLKLENVEGLIIDLRNNGGGSLKMAIEISGLFINEGPVVQVKYRGENPRIKKDFDPNIQWKGPLVVMVNEISASASEIFAAAMQDYGRGIIMGGEQTYGKGTVQNIVPLNYYVRKYPKDLGVLKMTIQKFYRVNGGSTQIEGVYSDIAMPDRFSYMDFGERDLEGALPWDRVEQAKYNKTNTYSNFDDVVNKSKQRISEDSKFKSINEYAKWLKKNQDNNIYSLKYDKYKESMERRKEEGEKFKEALKYESDLSFISPKYEVDLFKKDTILKEKRNTWHKNLKKDIYINEALNVISELKIK
ncbi:MAG: carboxy terminal-processing peptidase [Tenacibaculum sp.]|nr:carboxy terminal-processing peptidase [Tenacibaculum sp.]